VPPAVSALRLTRRPAALVLLHGAADLRELLRHGLVREGLPRLLAAPLSALGARLIHPLEPALHAVAAADTRPVLVINATADPLLPDACVERLHQLFPTADVRWRSALHGVPEQRTAAAEAAHEVEDWLAARP
jgi:pimeloyl-ACP methyl ester carboxylesterase